MRFTEAPTVDRTATFTAGAMQIVVDDTDGVAPGYLIVGRPSTVENVIVGAGDFTINVPNTAMVAVGERVTATDIVTGASLIPAGTTVTAISAFDSNTNTVAFSHLTTHGSAQAAVVFDASPLFPAGTTVVALAGLGKINISAATEGGSAGILGSPGVTVRFIQQ